MKKIINFLQKISNVACYIAEKLRLLQSHEEYYVYVPNNKKPQYIHKNYESALQEALRIKCMWKKLNLIHEEIQILQIVKKFDSEIPF